MPEARYAGVCPATTGVLGMPAWTRAFDEQAASATSAGLFAEGVVGYSPWRFSDLFT